MKNNLLYLGAMMILVACSATSRLQRANNLTKDEKSEGWVLLFNGSDFSGWRQYNGTAMPDIQDQ